MAHVIVEQTLKGPPPSPEEAHRIARQIDRELARYHGRWTRTLLSADRSREICEFEAEDPAAVAASFEHAGQKVERVWIAEVASETGEGAAPAESIDALRPLDRALGHWQGSGTLTVVAGPHESTPTFQILSTFDCSRAVGGRGMTVRMTVTGLPDLPLWELDGLFGVDPGTGLCHLFGITTSGETHDHTGGWANDDTLELRYQGQGKEGDLLEIASIQFQPDGTWTLDLQVNQSGHETERTLLEFSR